MDEQVSLVLERGFPNREVKEVGATGISWNDKNETVKVDFVDEKEVYLKIAADGDGSRIAREVAVISYADVNCQVAVPTVLASDNDGEIPSLVTAPVAGESLLKLWSEGGLDERTTLIREIGAGLADIHSVRFEEHGHITGGDANDFVLETGPWTDVLVERIDWMREIAPGHRFGHHFDDVIAAVEANRELLDEAPAALLHGDPAHPNLFRSEDGIGFLDWELAHVGDPVRELRRARRHLIDRLQYEGDDRLAVAFHDGYRERAGGLPVGFEDRLPVYDAVTFLGTSTFFEKWAPDADEPTNELAAWVQEEMERRLAEIRGSN